MTASQQTRLFRIAAAQRTIAGLPLAASPATVSRLAIDANGAAPSIWVVRLLGIRMVGQGIVDWLRPRRGVALGSAAIDVTHAASMFALTGSQRYRRLALTSAIEATASAVIALSARRHLP
jgi:hypothetical protein